jgi:hypothetical protein
MTDMQKLARSLAFGPETPAPVAWSAQPEQQMLAKSRKKDDDEDDEEDDDEDSEDDEDEDDDPDDELTEDELRAELKKVRESLSKAGGSAKSKRDRIKRLTRELDEARKAKPTKDDDKGGDGKVPVDVEAVKAEARREAEAAANDRVKRAEVRSALRSAGVDKDSLASVARLVDLDDLDVDDDGNVDGIEDALDALRKQLPALFVKPRRKRESVAGEGDRRGDRDRGSSTKSATQRQADQLLGRK